MLLAGSVLWTVVLVGALLGYLRRVAGDRRRGRRRVVAIADAGAEGVRVE